VIGGGLVAELERVADVRLNEPMSAHTTFGVGGPADAFVEAASQEQLGCMAALCREHGLPLTIIGAGSNLLVGDGGVRGLVLHNRVRGVAALDERGNNGTRCFRVMSGMLLARLARSLSRVGLSGLEWAAGIPGTVGGAVVCNAGAFGVDMAHVVVGVDGLMPDGSTQRIGPAALCFGYRASALLASASGSAPVLLAVMLRLSEAAPEEALRRVEEYARRRRSTQPVQPSAGSVFKNPPGEPAGALIEQAELKGYRVGGAQFSPKHANFIVNRGGATAADVRALIQEAQERVWVRSGVMLDCEVQFVGEF